MEELTGDSSQGVRTLEVVGRTFLARSTYNHHGVRVEDTSDFVLRRREEALFQGAEY